MRQNIFEIRQRAKELMAQCVDIWHRNNRSDSLEGLDSDPLFKFLITALAYQFNESDNELEALRTELLDEFQNMLCVNEPVKAIPATAVVQLALMPNVTEMDVDSSMRFILKGTDNNNFNFIPLLKTKAIQVEMDGLRRVDGRRWQVNMFFPHKVKSLKGLAFALKNQDFHGLRVSMSDREIPLIAPWDFANLPCADCFSLDTLLYNQSQAVRSGNVFQGMAAYRNFCALDLYARQNLLLYVVDEMDDIDAIDRMELTFEFDGIDDNFSFKESDLLVNIALIVNAEVKTATLSADAPIQRIDDKNNGQFLHLLRPDEDQLLGNVRLQVRRIGADRFNEGRLHRLLSGLIDKYTSDYYAFQAMGNEYTDMVMHNLRNNLKELSQHTHPHLRTSHEGVYLMFAGIPHERSKDSWGDTLRQSPENTSLNVGYLTTNGAVVNSVLTSDAVFVVPPGFDQSKSHQVTIPQPGYDELLSEEAMRTATRYFIATDDRLVTETDLKLFCYQELATRFNVEQEMIASIRTHKQVLTRGSYHAYCIVVGIVLHDNMYVKRALGKHFASIENHLQRLMEVRTTGICPIQVKIDLDSRSK
ncbi:MAG: hypothetical protein Q4E55_03455 [Bacteroidales bacterium]|nr:hypothetical protein [Bacteroidales bacterium]